MGKLNITEAARRFELVRRRVSGAMAEFDSRPKAAKQEPEKLPEAPPIPPTEEPVAVEADLTTPQIPFLPAELLSPGNPGAVIWVMGDGVGDAALWDLLKSQGLSVDIMEGKLQAVPCKSKQGSVWVLANKKGEFLTSAALPRLKRLTEDKSDPWNGDTLWLAISSTSGSAMGSGRETKEAILKWKDSDGKPTDANLAKWVKAHPTYGAGRDKSHITHAEIFKAADDPAEAKTALAMEDDIIVASWSAE
jgi:hypothetical protein